MNWGGGRYLRMKPVEFEKLKPSGEELLIILEKSMEYTYGINKRNN